ERFLQYLTRVFEKDPRAQELISAISLGAERTIVNIPRGPREGRGRADTRTDTIIIEWEKDLSKTGNHAVDHLAEYLTGNWRSGQTYGYVLNATDGIGWRQYAPDWSELQSKKFSLAKSYSLREVRRFDLGPDRFGDFPFFLDEVLFRSQK